MTAAPRIIGLDLSLTSTGIAGDGWTERIESKLTGPARLREIMNEVVDFTDEGTDLVVLEGYSYASKNQAHQVGELGGVVRLALWRRGIPYVVVPPNTLKMFATGKGNAGKDEMLVAACRYWPNFDGNNDEADAAFLRLMGVLHYTDLPYYGDTVKMRAAQARAVASVTWPDLDDLEGVA